MSVNDAVTMVPFTELTSDAGERITITGSHHKAFASALNVAVTGQTFS